ncbi:MAG: hypothetical protein A2622_02445 [Bdellovibrionales bacterium RIFCSPHIGHO2_01_FULL_40_29]|nr:MAG: hypothetical protein A2622_02445 [Bdellovibrionales bacterium RIFCSPHIGHO2_01_FULL_40_29]OFZ33942.1 MAG: hypothetical protein A3D17_02865 [Bdellovibrionales bacterium RIFCSPHIGHO2_02_FULL_40_15]
MKNKKNKPQVSIKSLPRLRPSMRREAIHPADYNTYHMPYACEDCSHFASQTTTCTLGLNPAPHLREIQKKNYELSGQMALCRFQEID